MTGGGFGGCVVALVPEELVPAVQTPWLSSTKPKRASKKLSTSVKHHKEPDSAKRNTYTRTGWSAVSPVNPAQQRRDGGYADGLGRNVTFARVPMPDGSVRETLLGCASPEQYIEQTAFLGASIGRYANRIARSRFTLDGVTYSLLASRAKISCTAARKGLINVAGRLCSKMTVRSGSLWTPSMETEVSGQSHRNGALHPDRR